MTDVIICGIGGKMGKVLVDTAKELQNINIVGGVDKYCDANYDFPVFSDFSLCDIKCDAVIDFSRPEALESVLSYCKKNKVPAVLAPTGYQPEHHRIIENASIEVALFHSSNLSIGVNLLNNIVKIAAETLKGFDIEIVEKHHNKKADSPSGTALTLANSINSILENKKNYVYGRHSLNDIRTDNEIGIHAVRGGTAAGEHDVIFMGNNEIVTLSHSAHSKAVFAEGAFKAAEFIKDKTQGLYSMSDMLGGR